MEIKSKVAVVTGAGRGIGRAVALELAGRGAKAIALVDQDTSVQEVARTINAEGSPPIAEAFIGNVVDADFRRSVYDAVYARHGVVQICVPAAGITRDALSVKIDKATSEPVIYPLEDFRVVTEVDLIAPIYWSLEMVAQIASHRQQQGPGRWDPAEGIRGTVILIGSISSLGNKGQIAYAAAKAGLQAAAATLTAEAIYYGVRCGVIHPGFVDTALVRALGDDFIRENILPQTQLQRLIRPEEIADAICFMITNSAVSGPLWTDAGWRQMA